MDFKTIISPDYITRLGEALLARGLAPGARQAFEDAALEGLDALELKARVEHVRDALAVGLEGYKDFAARCEFVMGLIESANLGGDTSASFEWWPLTSWIAAYGLEEPEIALDTLLELTRVFTAEFDVRPFLEHHRTLTLDRLEQWRDSDDHHDRRLVSEGTRAYLPWGKQVKWLLDEPEVILELIEPLRDDPSDYVRRSVANNINDMTRRHPDWVVEQLESWGDGASEDRQWVIRHALRSLVKKGHSGALALLGFSNDVDADVCSFTATKEVRFGDALKLEVELESTSRSLQPVVLDFAIHHVKANGSRTAKVFKWKTFDLEPLASHKFKKSHKIKPITTRRYFPGTHKVDVLLNGECVASQEFELIMDEEA